MVPQGYAAPNAALNSTINRGNALAKKLALFGIFVTRLEINPVVPDAPTRGVSIPDAEALGIVPDDFVHLLFEYAGGEGNQAEVAVIEKLIAPCTVSGVLAIFSGLFPSLTAAQTESRALTALANLPAVATALAFALA